MLLDTCALLWLAQGGGKLSVQVLRRLDEAPFVYVSAISGFEISIKYMRGKLELPVLPSDWFATILTHHDLKQIPLDLDICIRSAQLAPVHNDPCDRMIIATAHIHRLVVVTTDPVFAKYDIRTMA